MVFEAVDADGFEGDIAVDDVNFAQGICGGNICHIIKIIHAFHAGTSFCLKVAISNFYCNKHTCSFRLPELI